MKTCTECGAGSENSVDDQAVLFRRDPERKQVRKSLAFRAQKLELELK